MALRQYDVVKRIAWPASPTGWYYWSSVYYYDRADFSSDIAVRTRVRNVDSFQCLVNVQYVKMITKEPPGRGNVISVVSMAGNTGGQAADPNGYSMLMVMRAVTLFSDGRPSYRYCGRPMAARWYHGESLTPAGLAWLGGYLGAMRATSGFPPARNLTGGAMIASPTPHLLHRWQMRHGTERRERVY